MWFVRSLCSDLVGADQRSYFKMAYMSACLYVPRYFANLELFYFGILMTNLLQLFIMYLVFIVYIQKSSLIKEKEKRKRRYMKSIIVIMVMPWYILLSKQLVLS